MNSAEGHRQQPLSGWVPPAPCVLGRPRCPAAASSSFCSFQPPMASRIGKVLPASTQCHLSAWSHPQGGGGVSPGSGPGVREEGSPNPGHRGLRPLCPLDRLGPGCRECRWPWVQAVSCHCSPVAVTCWGKHLAWPGPKVRVHRHAATLPLPKVIQVRGQRHRPRGCVSPSASISKGWRKLRRWRVPNWQPRTSPNSAVWLASGRTGTHGRHEDPGVTLFPH